jgi:hypothetical protein
MEPAVYRRAGGMILVLRQVPTGWNYGVIETYKYLNRELISDPLPSSAHGIIIY